MKKIKILLTILKSFKNRKNRNLFIIKLHEYAIGIDPQSQQISTQSSQQTLTLVQPPQQIGPYNMETLRLGSNHKILLVLHEFSRTGSPQAVLYLARALFSLYGIRPIVISPIDGPIREDFEQEGFITIVDPLLFNYQTYSSDVCDFVASFEKVIVTSLACFNFIGYFRGFAKGMTWWIHETDAGFNSVVSRSNDLPMLFKVCESIWLGSPLSFPYALKYASIDKLHLLLYGCCDTALQSDKNITGKLILSIIGSVEPRKGQDIFLDAIEQLPLGLRQKAIFRIIGSSMPFKASEVFYEKILSRAKGISEVECIPNMSLEELHKYYSETDVIISASRDDPMPIVVTQGMMFSKACICSSAIGQAQLIQNEKNGLIFSNDSAEELAEKMAWVIQNPVHLNALGIAGRAIFDQYFHMTSFIDNVGKLMLSDNK